MKDSIKFLILSLIGTLCYIGYIILVCFRGPALSDFLIISVNMFIWLSVAIIPDLFKLRRAEKEQSFNEDWEIIIDDEDEE